MAARAASPRIGMWRETLFGAAPLTSEAKNALDALVTFATERETASLEAEKTLEEQETRIADLEDALELQTDKAPASPSGVESRRPSGHLVCRSSRCHCPRRGRRAGEIRRVLKEDDAPAVQRRKIIGNGLRPAERVHARRYISELEEMVDILEKENADLEKAASGRRTALKEAREELAATQLALEDSEREAAATRETLELALADARGEGDALRKELEERDRYVEALEEDLVRAEDDARGARRGGDVTAEMVLNSPPRLAKTPDSDNEEQRISRTPQRSDRDDDDDAPRDDAGAAPRDDARTPPRRRGSNGNDDAAPRYDDASQPRDGAAQTPPRRRSERDDDAAPRGGDTVPRGGDAAPHGRRIVVASPDRDGGASPHRDGGASPERGRATARAPSPDRDASSSPEGREGRVAPLDKPPPPPFSPPERGRAAADARDVAADETAAARRAATSARVKAAREKRRRRSGGVRGLAPPTRPFRFPKAAPVRLPETAPLAAASVAPIFSPSGIKIDDDPPVTGGGDPWRGESPVDPKFSYASGRPQRVEEREHF